MSTAIIEKPTLGPCRLAPYYYQAESIAAVGDEFRNGVRRTLLIQPTGCGKTITFGLITRRVVERGRRVLILAHRDELIQQAVEKLDFLGVEAAIEQGSEYARAIYEPDVVVGTVQTLQGKRLASWDPDYFWLIIIDEAHHATSKTYRNILKHFSGARVLGVTATPDRADGEDLGQVFESVAYDKFTLWDAMTAPPPGPYLSRLIFDQADIDIDLRDLRPSKEDFTDADLAARIGPMVEELSREIKKRIEDRPTVIFTPGVKVAQGMATALESLGLNFTWSSGDDPNRELKVKALKAGDFQGVCNDSLFTEGFDWPECSAVVLLRPTKSRNLYSQQVGRGTRLASGKLNCKLVDFNYLTSTHDLVVPTELFDSPSMDSEVGTIAAKMAKGQKGVDLLTVMERAKAEHKRQQVLRIKAREGKTRARWVSYDPLSVFDSMGLAWRGPKDPVKNRATERQASLLRDSFKVADADNLSKARASTLISFLMQRRKAGLATHPQVQTLISLGMEPEAARALGIREASAEIDARKANRRTG